MGERLGLPSVSIMTEKFASAAELMSAVLGAPDYPFIVIEHPISSASREALVLRAQSVATDVVARLTSRS